MLLEQVTGMKGNIMYINWFQSFQKKNVGLLLRERYTLGSNYVLALLGFGVGVSTALGPISLTL